eukprot:1160265-Pleurochrysis_carterae.AAC.1
MRAPERVVSGAFPSARTGDVRLAQNTRSSSCCPRPCEVRPGTGAERHLDADGKSSPRRAVSWRLLALRAPISDCE